MAASACFGTIAYVVAAAALSEYRATASLIIVDSRSSQSDLRGSIYDADLHQAAEVHVAELRDGGLIDQVIDRFNLGGGDPSNDTSDVVKAARQSFQVSTRDNGRQIEVSFAAPDPGLAVAVANDLATLYIEGLRYRLAHAEAEESMLRQRALQAAEEQVSAAQQRLEVVRASHAAAAVPVQHADSLSLSEELQKMELSRADDERKAAEIRAAIAEGRAERYVSAQALPLVRQLIEVKAHIMEQAEKLPKSLLPNHPRRLELASDIAGIDRQLATHAAKIADQFERAASATRRTEANLKARLKSLRQAQTARPEQLGSVREAEQNLTTQREALSILRTSVEQPSAVLPMSVTPATAASVDVSPRAHAIAAAIGLIVFMIAAAATLFSLSSRKPPANRHRHSAASGLA